GRRGRGGREGAARERAEAHRAPPPLPAKLGPNRLAPVEAEVTADSALIGRSAADLHLRERYGVNVLAIGRRGRQNAVRLRRLKFLLGDAIVFQARRATIYDTLAVLRCLPLAGRPLQLGSPRQFALPVILLG